MFRYPQNGTYGPYNPFTMKVVEAAEAEVT